MTHPAALEALDSAPTAIMIDGLRYNDYYKLITDWYCENYATLRRALTLLASVEAGTHWIAPRLIPHEIFNGKDNINNIVDFWLRVRDSATPTGGEG